MASIKGFTLKNIKRPMGREGYGLLASLYLNGKKIGTYEDWGDGACEDVRYDKPEYKEAMTKVIIEFAKENPNEFVENLYNERPHQYAEEVERFKKMHPYIPDEDITIRTMASRSIVYIVSALEALLEEEKLYKKFLKDGYDVMGIKGTRCQGFKSNVIPMDEIEGVGFDKIYKRLEDFVK